mmetsp:Transcript_9125/g.16839  ORF Transcript_9125/g.16839 Transcript_9125/m.16839 type:complete len:160 (+) Transcript_9125:1055-1534(+)
MVSLDPKVRPMKRDKKKSPSSPFNVALARAYGAVLFLVLVVAAIGYGTGLFRDRDNAEKEVDDNDTNNNLLLYVTLGIFGGLVVLLALYMFVVPFVKRGVRRGVSAVRSGAEAAISAPGRAWGALRGSRGQQSVTPKPGDDEGDSEVDPNARVNQPEVL